MKNFKSLPLLLWSTVHVCRCTDIPAVFQACFFFLRLHSNVAVLVTITHTHYMQLYVYYACVASFPDSRKGALGVEGESGNKTNAHVEIFEKA